MRAIDGPNTMSLSSSLFVRVMKISGRSNPRVFRFRASYKQHWPDEHISSEVYREDSFDFTISNPPNMR